LVASSNNRAVENVSAEFPAVQAVADDAGDMRYLRTFSNELLGRDSWGLIAAFLGRGANRAHFRKAFWDEDVGLAAYLAVAGGTPKVVQTTDPATGEVTTRPPRITTDERAPQDHNEALRHWKKARLAFKTVLNHSETTLRSFEGIRVLAMRLPDLAAAEVQARNSHRAALLAAETATSISRKAVRALARAQADRDLATGRLREQEVSRPGFLARLFRTATFRAWKRAVDQERISTRRAVETAQRAGADAAERKKQLDQATAAEAIAASELHAATDRLTESTQAVSAARGRLGKRFIDGQFFDLAHPERHQVAPWLGEAEHRIRDDVFAAAIAVHKAFVDAAAKPLRHNLGALMSTFGGRPLPGPAKDALLADLWTSLFLVAPMVSTTFASVERMLGRLPPEALGWLLVDEAGQALSERCCAPSVPLWSAIRSR
jgi:hypothetical protein